MLWDCNGRGWGPGRTARTFFFLSLSLAVALPGIAAPATVELVSRMPARRAPDTTGIPLTSSSLEGPVMSADGRFLAFTSPAANLVPGQIDRNEASDLFLYDRETGAVSLVSHTAGSASTSCNGSSFHSALSADGRFVVFSSDAQDLAPLGDNPSGPYVFLFERTTGAVTLVSRRAGSLEGADGPAVEPRISADGNVIAYWSSATDLLAAPGPEGSHIYVYDRRSGVTARVAGPQAESIESYALSADGRFVAVSARSDRAPFPGGLLFLWDRVTGGTRQIGQRASFLGLSLSADGRFLAFSSNATNLIPGVTDRNRLSDVFLYDWLTGSVSLASRSAGAANVTDPEGGFEPSISADGSAIVYLSVKGSFPGVPSQAFVFDRLAGTTARVTRSARSASRPADQGADAGSLSISADGRHVAFSSPASNLVTGQSGHFSEDSDVFVLDRATGSMTLVSHVAGSPGRTANDSSRSPVLSADGGWVAFVSKAGNLVADLKDPVWSEDVFLWERSTAETRVVSLHPPGMASLSPPTESEQPSVSDDGRFVSFVSLATNLVPGFRDENGARDVFLYDRLTRKTTLVSRAHGARTSANAFSSNSRISRDGNWVLYESWASNLVRGQKDDLISSDVFLYDRIGQRTILVSRSSESPRRAARGGGVPRGLSADGSAVIFESISSDLIPGQLVNLESNVFLWDRRTGGVTLVNHVPESPLQPGFRGASFSSMSPDGNFVAFTSAAWDFVPGDDADSLPDAYLWDRRTGKVEALHLVPGESSRNPIVSADGRYVAFAATASQDPDDGPELVAQGVFLLERATGTLREVAAPSPGGWPLGLSPDGRHLLFQSGGEEPPGVADLYLFDRVSGETRLVSDTVAFPQTSRRSVEAQLSPDGQRVAFYSRSPDFGPREIHNVVLYDRKTGSSTLVSRSRLAPGQGGNGHCRELALSATGGFVAFTSYASDLVPRDFNMKGDVFLYSPGEQP